MLVSALWLIVSRVLGVEVRLVDGMYSLLFLWCHDVKKGDANGEFRSLFVHIGWAVVEEEAAAQSVFGE